MDLKLRLTLGVLSCFAATVLATTAAAQSLCVTASRANLRAGPGTEHRVNWTVYKNMPLVQVEKQGEWIRVRDVDGDLHWIYDRLVSAGQDCVTIRADIANIRRGPGTRFRKWFTVKRYTSFRKTGEQGGWVKIEYEGEEMWVYNTLIWPTG